eukprot:Gb_21781 [translate_table: standard]
MGCCMPTKVMGNELMELPKAEEREIDDANTVYSPADLMNPVDHLVKVLHMTSANSESSYTHNSGRQGFVFQSVQPFFHQLLQLLRIPQQSPLRIADLGYAIGMNAIAEVDFVVRTLKSMCTNSCLQLPQLQVFFNDLPSNDFNGLFRLLKENGADYFAAGVPASFYDVLFPRDSIHVCLSIMALHWLSRVPAAVEQEESGLYNRGKIWINGGKAEVAKAYAEQSQKDLVQFFRCRSEEMASGGVMFLCAMGCPDWEPPQRQVSLEGEYCGADFEAAWQDLISEGIVKSETRDSFNLPWYFPNAGEMTRAIKASGEFEIQKLEVCSGVSCMSEESFEKWVSDVNGFGKQKSNLVRSFVGSMVEQKIGGDNADALFERLEKRSSEFLEKGIIHPSRFVTCIVAAIVRK